MEFAIRKALPEDAYDRSACHVSSWRSAYKGIVPDEYLNDLSVEKGAEKFRQTNLNNPDFLYYCATYDNKIIGNLVIGKSREEDKPDAGEICGIYLIEEFWGKGYGKTMMDYAIDKLKCMGYNEIILWVLEENDRARRFYEKCNFVFDGTKREIEIGKVLIKIRYVLYL